MMRAEVISILGLVLFSGLVIADQIPESPPTVDINIDEAIASKTDDQVSTRPTIRLDGLSPEQLAEIENRKEKLDFQVSIGKIMNLISSPIYPQKEVFLRELISNASDALDKIRLLSLLEAAALEATRELSIKIKIDKENKILHIIDTGIGMTRDDLIKNLGTIANSGTNEFIKKMSENVSDKATLNDMIGQFGIGFYSSFLVASRVVVTTKHNDDKQYIWESDSQSFSIVEDPRGNTLQRGTQISLILKDEATEYLEPDTIRNLVKKYSEFIMFPISLWASKTVKVEEPVEEAAPKETEDEEAQVEEETETKTKEVEKTVWDWELLNDMKPIWTIKASEVTEEQYNNFYKSLTKDTSPPLAHTHFVAEGEVSFKSLLFIPSVQPSETFNRYGTKTENIKLYVRRVFITSEFSEMLPNYLGFIQGVVDSDDLPLNLSRERLQQHKLLKVIKKKLVRKALDMIKKLDKDQVITFWKEYSTNIKLGVVEDSANRARLAKILRFYSSNQPEMTTLEEYVSRMKPKQTHIYYLAGSSRSEVENSPFVERLRKKGYEVLYLVEAVDEYCITALPEFDGKKFQNVAKEGFALPEDKDRHDAAVAVFEPLLKWLNDVGLKDLIAKAAVSERLTDSPCALVASMFGWTGNMERLAISSAHQKTDDPNRAYHLNQRKTLEINPRHPLIKELLRRVQEDPQDEVAKDTARMLFHTATLRSGYMLKDTAEFSNNVEVLMRKSLGISPDEQVEEEEEEEPVDDTSSKDDDEEKEDKEEHDEL